MFDILEQLSSGAYSDALLMKCIPMTCTPVRYTSMTYAREVIALSPR
jgi:hypothetical protein